MSVLTTRYDVHKPPRRGADLIAAVFRSAPALILFIVLCLVGSLTIPGLDSAFSVRAMVVLASFLGIAAMGQTLCALVGGLDLSIPYFLDAINVVFPYLIAKHLPVVVAIIAVIGGAALLGAISGLVSWHAGVHPLIVTLGMGFAVLGGGQILASVNSSLVGGQGGAPPWMVRLTAANGQVLGLHIPPVAAIWLVLGLALCLALRFTIFGRNVYALGDSPAAAKTALVPVRRTWVSVFVVSGICSALAGLLLVGYTGGGSASSGDPYLFTTIAAVVIGGTSLLGGRGGYGATAIGVGVLTVLTTILVGWGLSTALQEAVLGALIVAGVSVYGGEPHARDQV